MPVNFNITTTPIVRFCRTCSILRQGFYFRVYSFRSDPIEIEVENPDILKEAPEAGGDIIMLDNMSVEDTKEAVRLTAGKPKPSEAEMLQKCCKNCCKTGRY